MSLTQGSEPLPGMTRDPRIDPQPGDILRSSREAFPRKVLKCESDRLLVEIGAAKRCWMTLTQWHKWARPKRSVTVQAMALEKSVNQEG